MEGGQGFEEVDDEVRKRKLLSHDNIQLHLISKHGRWRKPKIDFNMKNL